MKKTLENIIFKLEPTSWSFSAKLSVQLLSLFCFFLPNLSRAQITYTTCPSGDPAPGYSQTQQMVAEGVGLDYAVAGGECGQPMTVTLPPGAVPVTAFAYVEYDIGSDTGAPNDSTINFNGNTTAAGVEAGAPVTWTVYQNILYNMQYGLKPTWITGGGAGGSVSTYSITTGETGTCMGQSVMVLYTNPAETSVNAVAIGDGNNAWHVEENNEIIPGNGAAPPDADLNWSCLGLNCSTSSTKFSVLGGRDNCNDGAIDGDEDWIVPYGSGPVTNTSGGSDNGSPPIFQGPPGVLNCGGKGIPGDQDRTYNLGTNFNSGATSLEWGLYMNEQNAKASFWQQALVSQYQCNPVTQCSVTNTFNGTYTSPPPGWQIGQVPWGEGNWAESGGSISYQNGSGVAPTYNFLLNNNVATAPGTLLVSMCMGNAGNGGLLNGIVLGMNPSTGNGYGINFYNNGCANSGSEINFVSYSDGTPTTITTTTLSSSTTICACPCYVQVIITGSCQYIVSLSNSATGPFTPLATYTGGSCSGGYMGFMAYNSQLASYQSFQFTGTCTTPTPTKTPTNTSTYTSTATKTSTSSATSTATVTSTATLAATATSTATLSATLSATYSVTSTSTTTKTATSSATSTATLAATATNSATLSATSTATLVSTNTKTATLSATATATLSATLSPTNTRTATLVPTLSFTNTATDTAIATNTATLLATLPATLTPTNSFTPLFTRTPTSTVTVTATATPTNSPTVTKSATNTATVTATFSPTNSNTITNTFTLTDTKTSTKTPTNTFTATNTRTPTNTDTITATNTATNTFTLSYTPTNTDTLTATHTPTNSFTPTNTFTVTDTKTPTATPTNTFTPTNSRTPTNTATNTDTGTMTNTFTFTRTPTNTDTFTDTNTPSNTFTSTNTFTLTDTKTPTNSPTESFTPTNTRTSTNTPTNTDTPTITNTYTFTRTPTNTDTLTVTNTPTNTFTVTKTYTNTDTKTPTNSATSTVTSTATFTTTNTATLTPTYTVTLTATATPPLGVSLSKEASASSAQSGTTITYTIDANVINTNLLNAVVDDTLPSNETFAGFVSSPTGTSTNYNSANSLLTWTLPATLIPGQYQLTYRGVINNFVPAGTVLTNNARIDYTNGPPVFTSSNVTVIGDYQVKIGVYNEAGELVKQITIEELSQEISNFQLQNETITSLNGMVYVEVDGQQIASWNGTNQSGNPVANGNYYIQVTSTSPNGVVHNQTQIVTVNRPVAQIVVEVYNEAGEVVKHLYSYAQDAGNVNMGNVALSSDVIAPIVGTPVPGEATGSVTITMNGTSLVWNGTSDSGSIVANGHYEIQVQWSNGTGGDEDVSKGILVQRGNSPVANGAVFAKPNILKDGQTMTVVEVNSAMALTLNLHLYNVAGELIKSVPGQSGEGYTDLNVSGLASGLYFIVVDLTDTNGNFLQRETTQIVIER